jgi:uncharacterized protein involved in cysteine biosynthesis
VISGFLAPFRGFAYLARRRRLWRWAAIPILLNCALVAASAWAWIEVVVPWFAGLVPGGEGWLATSGRVIVKVVAYVATLPLALGVYLFAAMTVGGPFYEVLCEQIERDVLGPAFREPPPRSFARRMSDSLAVGAGNLVVVIVGGVISLFCPIVIPGAGAAISMAIGWFLAGFSFVAYPFDWRGVKLRPKVGFAFRHLPATLGLGFAITLLLFPIVTLPFAAPCAVAGAALLFPGGASRRVF